MNPARLLIGPLFVLAIVLSLGCRPSLSQNSGTLIVLNKSEASASLISLQSGQIIANVATGNGPHEVAVSPDGETAVVTNYGVRGAPGSSLTVIDLPGLRVVATIDLQQYQRPHGIVFLADGERILVTAEAQQSLLTVHVPSGEIEQAIATEQEVSHMVAYEPNSRRAFVANIGSGSVTVIDLQRGERIATIETGAGAEGIDISPDGSEVWVSNRAADNLSIIDVESLRVVQSLPCASFPIRVKFTPDGQWALVSNARSGDLAVFDARERKEVRRIDMNVETVAGKEQRLFSDRFGESPVPVGILVHPEGKLAFIANTNADVVTVIDLQAWAIVRRLATGKEPDGLGFTPLAVKQRSAE